MSKEPEDAPKTTTGPIYINPNKKYGLIISNKPPVIKPKTTNIKPLFIFNDDDDDDDADIDTFRNEKKHIASTNTSTQRIKKETQLEIEKALLTDPSVFEYDQIYDQMEEQKSKLNPPKLDPKEPKYIAGIMKAAAKRKMQFEKLQERKIQSEREKEGDLWGDKEVFVTQAYRQRMEERQVLEEEDRRQDQIEALLDVRKAKDLSGFYSNILKMKSGEMVIEEEAQKDKKQSLIQKNYRVKKDQSDDEEEEPDKNNLDKDEVMSDDDKNDQEEVKAKPEEEEVAFKEPLPKKSKDEDKIPEELPQISKEEKNRLRREQLFKKRTVGQRLNEQIAEYFIRKMQILSAKSYIERE